MARSSPATTAPARTPAEPVSHAVRTQAAVSVTCDHLMRSGAFSGRLPGHRGNHLSPEATRRETERMRLRSTTPGRCTMKGCTRDRKQFYTGTYDRRCLIHKDLDDAHQAVRLSREAFEAAVARLVQAERGDLHHHHAGWRELRGTVPQYTAQRGRELNAPRRGRPRPQNSRSRPNRTRPGNPRPRTENEHSGRFRAAFDPIPELRLDELDGFARLIDWPV